MRPTPVRHRVGGSAYRGRFAPTPSGPLHLGSLLTALASWLDARAHKGRWLLRIDDLDEARCRSEAESTILRQLEAHGLTWDESPRRQSAHRQAYAEALQALEARGRSYVCSCSRARLMRESLPGADGPVYAGVCRRTPSNAASGALRFKLEPGSRRFSDRVQGDILRDAETDIGDFIVRRSDGIAAYHLACAVDEARQGITHVVRGADLLASTICQLALGADLAYMAPDYAHVPVLTDNSGRKLSKQNRATALNADRPARNLAFCLAALSQNLPASAERLPVQELLDWAVKHWRMEAVPHLPSLELEAPLGVEPGVRQFT